MNPLTPTNLHLTIPIATGLSLGGAAFFYGMFSSASTLFGSVIVRAPAGCGPRIALTFDDGPTPDGTAPVLDILASLRCPATFFFIGQNAHRWPHLVRRAFEEGHQIENHSYDHWRLGVIRHSKYWNVQWRQTDQAIAAAGGPGRTRFFRPPMGFKNWSMCSAARESGLRIVSWSLRGRDGVPTTPDAILARVLPHAQSGDIIALHDGHEPNFKRDPSPTLQALPRIIRGLRDKGLEPVRLDDLLTPATSPAATARAT